MKKVILAVGCSIEINRDVEEVWKICGNYKDVTWLCGEEWNKKVRYEGEGVGCKRFFGDFCEECYGLDEKNYTLIYGHDETMLVILHFDRLRKNGLTRCRWTCQLEVEEKSFEEKKKEFQGYEKLFIEGFQKLGK